MKFGATFLESLKKVIKLFFIEVNDIIEQIKITSSASKFSNTMSFPY
jgi:hypothetical protein